MFNRLVSSPSLTISKSDEYKIMVLETVYPVLICYQKPISLSGDSLHCFDLFWFLN